ncbi:MAG: phage tail tube protein [Candidatus Accumulibacter sp.]|jgi:hypothetical protein|nr:phage tail tube protein [Accumulibacter sp.]
MADFSGRAFIHVDGITLASMPGATMNPGGYSREPVITDLGVVGSTEKVVEARVKCDAAISSEDDLVKIGSTINATITFETSSGSTYLVRNAVCAAPPEYTSDAAKASLEFFGKPAEKV